MKNLIIDPTTQQPTEAGLVWLQQAGVRLEDILTFESQANVVSMSPKRFAAGQKAKKIMATPDTRVQRTLALLKIAAVIAREKFEKMYQVVHVGQTAPQTMSPVKITNVKKPEISSTSSNHSRGVFLSRSRGD